jgi:TolA-binding protein
MKRPIFGFRITIALKLLTLALVSLLSVQTSLAGFQADYDKALATFRGAKVKADYEQAAAQFAALTQRKDAGSLQGNTIFWLAESYYGLKDYLRALNCFEKVLLTPKSNKEEDARYKVAVCYVRLGWNDAAKWELTRFLRDFPSSSKVETVRKELTKLPK